jgi:hypothetical protein
MVHTFDFFSAQTSLALSVCVCVCAVCVRSCLLAQQKARLTLTLSFKGRYKMGDRQQEKEDKGFDRKVRSVAIDVGSGLFAASCVAPGIKIVDQGMCCAAQDCVEVD